ncbi:glycine--tRNA ligase subunit beta [Peribacillus sp. SCS-26]|uniref:glycine--tRNA ligase subunit beta n=1 Tax=Paraperibacillus marinus TaxID=3115295 RepID=UPI003906848C
MSKKDFLLEIGLEEMPARFVTSSMNQLKEKVSAWLKEHSIEFDEIKAFSTPRRLAVLIGGAAAAQSDIHEEAKGPAKKIALDGEGNWSKAAMGFARGQGVSADDIFFKELNGIEYAYVKKFIKGQPTKELLPQLKEVITSLHFPKNMRWADEDLKFVRPIKWLTALFGNEIIPFAIAGVEAGNTSRGHRFLGNTAEINVPAQYEEALKQQFVIADPDVRREMILEGIREIESRQGWRIPLDQELLEEVNNLVEYPSALFGSYEVEYLELPQEVLITSMKEHQRYFPVLNNEGELLPHFITVRNGNKDHLETVARGNEKVLRARLADAAFFYKEDLKTDIAASLKKLESIVYQEEIGTLSDKVGRVRKLAAAISEKLELDQSTRQHADRAAEISKFDLVTNMVYEFPELQGLMGEKYARIKGEPEEVALAINEHYMPRNAEDNVPESLAGSVLSIADKLDTIVSCFSIGIIPTGSQDPYALRRQASGIVAILAGRGWDIELEELLALSLDEVEAAGFAKKEREDLSSELLQFFKMRIKHLLTERGVRYDLIDSVLAGKAGNVASLIERAEVLNARSEQPEFKGAIEALSRVMNLGGKAEKGSSADPQLFENQYERELHQLFRDVKEQYGQRQGEDEKFALLASLKPSIEAFFEHTMVMAEDESLRHNRLALLSEMTESIRGFAEINKVMTG